LARALVTEEQVAHSDRWKFGYRITHRFELSEAVIRRRASPALRSFARLADLWRMAISAAYVRGRDSAPTTLSKLPARRKGEGKRKGKEKHAAGESEG